MRDTIVLMLVLTPIFELLKLVCCDLAAILKLVKVVCCDLATIIELLELIFIECVDDDARR